MKVTVIAGARPNFVKTAALRAAMHEYPELVPRLVHTGQHYDARMSEAFFRDLEIPAPDVNLGVGGVNAARLVAEVMLRLVPLLTEDRPDVVLVVGDVTSTLAGALTAAKMGIRLAHVEAGLRSFDRTMPEEINRIVTDAVADYCFTTEPAANDNLAREGVAPDRVHYVGNVMIDTLFRFRERAAASPILEALGVAPRRYAVLTLHRPSNVDDATQLADALAVVEVIARDCPVVFPVHPRTRERLRGIAAPRAGVRPIEPLAYLDFVQLMANAACVLTDSGGVQEETTALGIPCLTLRTTTERPITVAVGTNRVVGLDPGRIETAWTQIRRGEWPTGRLPELWDGKASDRVVRTLLQERRP